MSLKKQGCIIGCAVVPIAMCITWKRCNGTGAVVGCVTGFICAITGWLVCTAKLNDGVITVETTFQDYCMLTGNLLSIGIGGIITVGWSVIRPANFDWEITRAINRKAGEGPTSTVIEQDTSAGTASSPSSSGKNEKDLEVPAVGEASAVATPREEKNVDMDVNAFEAALEAKRLEEDKDMEGLRKAFRFAAISALTLTFLLIFLIPLPLFFSSHGTFVSLSQSCVLQLTRQSTPSKASPHTSSSRSSGSSLGVSWSASSPCGRRGRVSGM